MSSRAALPSGGMTDCRYGRKLPGIGIREFVNKELVRIAAASDAA